MEEGFVPNMALQVFQNYIHSKFIEDSKISAICILILTMFSLVGGERVALPTARKVFNSSKSVNAIKTKLPCNSAVLQDSSKQNYDGVF